LPCPLDTGRWLHVRRGLRGRRRSPIHASTSSTA
jgi:hypothetical protein